MNISEKDARYIWHPFTQQLNAAPAISIVKGEGVYLIDAEDQRYIDAISSWWVNLHGHCHPYISEKISDQLFTLEHALFSGFTHPWAVELGERLLKHLPEAHSKIFYSDNGSTSVEVALKMCLQYWDNRNINKNIFIAFENAYHGDTFGGMSVGARNVFNNAFESLLFEVKHIPLPTARNIDSLKETVKQLAADGKVAGFVFEPLVQGAAGMLMYEAPLLDELIAVCKEANIVCIADEVMTGFGRTGTFFASDQLKNMPDIICLSKGLTGGYLPLGVTSCAEFIYEAFLSEDKRRTFFHGHSYTANPISCSAALASLDLMESEKTWTQIRMIERSHLDFISKISGNKKVKDVRVKGVILAIELSSEEGSHYLHPLAATITQFFLQKRIIIRPLGNVFYLIPPYVISKEQLLEIYSAIELFLKD